MTSQNCSKISMNEVELEKSSNCAIDKPVVTHPQGELMSKVSLSSNQSIPTAIYCLDSKQFNYSFNNNGQFTIFYDIINILKSNCPVGESVPNGIKQNISFIINNEHNNRLINQGKILPYIDDYQPWRGQYSRKRTYGLFKDKYKRVFVYNGKYYYVHGFQLRRKKIQRFPEETVTLFITYYKSYYYNKQYKRKVIQVIEKSNNLPDRLLNTQIVEYIGDNPDFIQIPKNGFIGNNNDEHVLIKPDKFCRLKNDLEIQRKQQAESSSQSYSGKPETSWGAMTTISSEMVLFPDDSSLQPTAPKLQKKALDIRFHERHFDEERFPERQFEDRHLEERRQCVAAQSAAPPLEVPTERQVQQPLQMIAPPELHCKCAAQIVMARRSNQDYLCKPETSRSSTATVSSGTARSPVDSPLQPTPPQLQNRPLDLRFHERRFQERQLENGSIEERRQMVTAQSAHVDAPLLEVPTQMQVQQHLQVTAQPPYHVPSPPRKEQVLTPPVKVSVVKPTPVKMPLLREYLKYEVADHQRSIMSDLFSLWKCGMLCDASICNESSTVMIHKVVLCVFCPKLFSVFSTDTLSNSFLQVNFPEEVNWGALNAFAEYMYTGILNLNHDILKQLKIIAKAMDMEKFEQVCDSHLTNHMHQQPVASVESYTNVPLIQPSMQFPSMMSYLPSLSSTISPTSITTRVNNDMTELSEPELARVNKDTAAVFHQESDVPSLAPNKSANTAGFVIYPSIKTQPVGRENYKYGHLISNSNNQTFTSNIPSYSSSSSAPASASNHSVPASQTVYAIPFSETKDAVSTHNTQTLVYPCSSHSSSSLPAAASTSTTSVPASQTDFTIPFLETKDVVSTYNNNQTFLFSYPSSSSSSLPAPTSTATTSVPTSQTDIAIPFLETSVSHSYDSPHALDLSPLRRQSVTPPLFFHRNRSAN